MKNDQIKTAIYDNLVIEGSVSVCGFIVTMFKSMKNDQMSFVSR